jgi:hypothetical protein
MPARTPAPSRAWTALISSIVGVLVVGGTLVPAAHAQEDDLVRRARERLQAVQAEANAAYGRYRSTLAARDEVQAEISQLEQAIPALRAKDAELRASVAARAASLYKHLDGGGIVGLLDSDDVGDVTRREKLTRSAASYDLKRADDLRTLGDLLAEKQAQLEQRRAELDTLVSRLEREKVAFEAKVAEANRALEVAEQIGALRAAGEPVLGPTVLTADEIVRWYRSTGSTPRLSGVTIEQLAAMFVEEGRAENVRGDFAFAQSYLETGGFFHNGADNNFAGLGFCDGCTSETVFPSARDGVRAQIQHLKNYADRGSRSSQLRNPPSPSWYGRDPAVAVRNFDTFFAKGWAPTWQMMGRGNWATDPGYSGKVIGLYNRMIDFNKGG